VNNICSRWLDNNTLVHEIEIHKGSQWALYNPTVVYAGNYNGSPCE